jgi:hypothetical protein
MLIHLSPSPQPSPGGRGGIGQAYLARNQEEGKRDADGDQKGERRWTHAWYREAACFDDHPDPGGDPKKENVDRDRSRGWIGERGTDEPARPPLSGWAKKVRFCDQVPMSASTAMAPYAMQSFRSVSVIVCPCGQCPKNGRITKSRKDENTKPDRLRVSFCRFRFRVFRPFVLS